MNKKKKIRRPLHTQSLRGYYDLAQFLIVSNPKALHSFEQRISVQNK
jgi:hypothetical protein